MEAKHTPGPWRFVAVNLAFPDVLILVGKNASPNKDGCYRPDDCFDVVCEGVCGMDGEDCSIECNNPHDRRLIAAAPDLLEACKAVLDALENVDLGGTVLWISPPYQARGVHESAQERLREVIAKATGSEVAHE